MNTYVIEFSEDKCYFASAIINITVDADSSQEAVDWFRENYTNAEKYVIHNVSEVKNDWK